jgi:hypothetical protein
MPSMALHVRIPEPLYSRLKELCEDVQQPSSVVIRQSVQYVLDHPELWFIFFPQTVEDTSTLEQRQAAEQYLKSLGQVDLDVLLAEHHPPLPY